MATTAEIIIKVKDDASAAFGSVDKSVDGMSASFDNAAATAAKYGKVILAAVGPTLAAGAAIFKLASDSAKFADNIGKTAQMIGVSSEALSGLKFAAELGGAGLPELTTGFRTLARNIADTADGTGEARETFEKYGIAVTDVNGNLRTSEDVFFDVAEKVKELGSGTEATAAAQELLGRSGAKLIPTLKSGADGLRDQIEEARRYGVVVGVDAAKAAADFNDAMLRMTTASDGVSLKIGNKLMPVIERTITFFVKADEEGNSLVDGALTRLVAGAELASNAFEKYFAAMDLALTGMGALKDFAFGDLGAAEAIQAGKDAAKAFDLITDEIAADNTELLATLFTGKEAEQVEKNAKETGKKSGEAVSDGMVDGVEKTAPDRAKAMKAAADQAAKAFVEQSAKALKLFGTELAGGLAVATREQINQTIIDTQAQLSRLGKDIILPKLELLTDEDALAVAETLKETTGTAITEGLKDGLGDFFRSDEFALLSEGLEFQVKADEFVEAARKSKEEYTKAIKDAEKANAKVRQEELGRTVSLINAASSGSATTFLQTVASGFGPQGQVVASILGLLDAFKDPEFGKKFGESLTDGILAGLANLPLIFEDLATVVPERIGEALPELAIIFADNFIAAAANPHVWIAIMEGVGPALARGFARGLKDEFKEGGRDFELARTKEREKQNREQFKENREQAAEFGRQLDKEFFQKVGVAATHFADEVSRAISDPRAFRDAAIDAARINRDAANETLVRANSQFNANLIQFNQSFNQGAVDFNLAIVDGVDKAVEEWPFAIEDGARRAAEQWPVFFAEGGEAAGEAIAVAFIDGADLFAATGRDIDNLLGSTFDDFTGRLNIWSDRMQGIIDSIPGTGGGGGGGGGGLISGTGTPLDRLHAGTPFVQRTGPAIVHRGERITPASENRISREAAPINLTINLNGVQDAQGLIRELQRNGQLRDVLARTVRAN